MSENEEVKFCSNCEEKIPLSKLILHERMCFLNIKKCDKCNKPVNVDDIEEHNNEYHNDKICNFCNKKFSNEDFKSHLNECDLKCLECRFCQMEIILRDLNEHEYVCGSKTEICNNCKQLIQKKDLINHKKIGCLSPDDDLLNRKIVINDEKIEKENKKKIKEIEKMEKKAHLNYMNSLNNNDLNFENIITPIKKNKNKKKKGKQNNFIDLDFPINNEEEVVLNLKTEKNENSINQNIKNNTLNIESVSEKNVNDIQDKKKDIETKNSKKKNIENNNTNNSQLTKKKNNKKKKKQKFYFEEEDFENIEYKKYDLHELKYGPPADKFAYLNNINYNNYNDYNYYCAIQNSIDEKNLQEAIKLSLIEK